MLTKQAAEQLRAHRSGHRHRRPHRRRVLALLRAPRRGRRTARPRSSPVRQWAWPATLDAFIVAGELLMLRAGLRRVTDRWAIALTATGSVGSIALNVAGVSGTGDTGAVPLLDYVVAAVPPTAALLAFGVLMRQIHQLVDQTPAGPGQCETAPLPHSPPTSGARPDRPSHRAVRDHRLRVSESKPRGGRPQAPRSRNSWRSAGSLSLSTAHSPGPFSGRPSRTGT